MQMISDRTKGDAMMTSRVRNVQPRAAKTTVPGWLTTVPQAGLGANEWSFGPYWFVSSTIKAAMAGGPEVWQHRAAGSLGGLTLQRLSTDIEAFGFRRCYVDASNDGITLYFASAAGIASVFHRNKTHIEIATTDVDLLGRFARYMGQILVEEETTSEGRVSALVHTRHGYEIQQIGTVGVKLERQNYAPDILEAFDHIIEDLQVKGPCGRLMILHGEPGSGKTFLVRALVQQLGQKTSCIIVPPHLVQQLGDPALLPALLQHKECCGREGPIVLICEDGDDCLVKRDKQNMSSIQSVLNMTDGLLGSMLDVRLLVTTNVGGLDIDPAAVRDGRLCRKIHVDSLRHEHAQSVLERLVPGAPDVQSVVSSANSHGPGMTLAQVYRHARTLGWRPTSPRPSASSASDGPTVAAVLQSLATSAAKPPAKAVTKRLSVGRRA